MIINLTSQQSTAMELMIDFTTGETEERMFLLEGFAELANLPLGGLSTLTLLKVVKKYFVAVSAPTNKAVGVLKLH